MKNDFKVCLENSQEVIFNLSMATMHINLQFISANFAFLVFFTWQENIGCHIWSLELTDYLFYSKKGTLIFYF